MKIFEVPWLRPNVKSSVAPPGESFILLRNWLVTAWQNILAKGYDDICEVLRKILFSA